ncbi:MAG: peptidoglycan-associated lipoprotein Pal [Desulfuromonadales bacterium]|nr:peptidoglycan-associated lipoprotein Pal [Desulfuromonadales bacterium]MDW7758026.1 peptidoglycan-associated lipoprotein Pal [Desulfuromonadales bacterium]
MNVRQFGKGIFLGILVALLATGCAKKPAPSDTLESDQAGFTQETVPSDGGGFQEQSFDEQAFTESPGLVDADVITGLERVFFEFDQYTLSEQSREVLANNAQYLKNNPGVKVVIEGHCDERGSDEYNLALGERRAAAAKNYVVSLGVAEDRMTIISYGEEIPLDPSTSEEAWAKNRRAEFKAVR